MLFSLNGNSQTEIKLTDYGFYHNEALSLYYKKQAGVKSKDFNQILTEMNLLMQNKYPSLFTNIDSSKATELMTSYNINRFDFKYFWNDKKEDFYQNYNVSRRVGLVIDNILNNNLSYEESLKLINDFKSQKDITNDELNYITIMESVFINSNSYWSINPSAKPGTKAIIADVAGTAIFFYTGIFAVIAGGAMSAFVNESQEP